MCASGCKLAKSCTATAPLKPVDAVTRCNVSVMKHPTMCRHDCTVPPRATRPLMLGWGANSRMSPSCSVGRDAVNRGDACQSLVAPQSTQPHISYQWWTTWVPLRRLHRQCRTRSSPCQALHPAAVTQCHCCLASASRQHPERHTSQHRQPTTLPKPPSTIHTHTPEASPAQMAVP